MQYVYLYKYINYAIIQSIKGWKHEKNYNYNEYLSDKAILLEVGNNKNTIEEARLCGEYFADVLASVIDEEQ